MEDFVMKRFTVILSVLVLATISAYAQAPDTLWTRTYGSSEADLGYCVQQTTDGGFVFVGFSYQSYYGGIEGYLAKTNNLGDTLWTAILGGHFHDFFYYVQETNDSCYIITGQTSSFGAGGTDVYLLKTDTLGNIIWEQTIGGSLCESGSEVQQTTDGGYIIVGGTQSHSNGSYDICIIKTNCEGYTTWTKAYGGLYSDAGNSIQQTVDGGYIIAGHSIDGGRYLCAKLLRTNENGDTLWTKDFAGTWGAKANSVCQTDDGGYAIIGMIYTDGNYHRNAYLIKTDAMGDTMWTKKYGGLDFVDGFYGILTNDNGFVIVGYKSNLFDKDVYIIKTDANGDTNWTKTIGGELEDMAMHVEQTSDDGYIIVGYTNSYGLGSTDIYVIRLDSEGTIVEDFGNPQPSSFILHPPHPNPFNSSTTISYKLQAASYVELKVYDVRGREVWSAVSSWQLAGEHRVVWDAGGLPSGVYFARLQTNGSTQTQKILLLK